MQLRTVTRRGVALAFSLTCLPALNACTESEPAATGPSPETAANPARPTDDRDIITLGGVEYLQDHQGGLYLLNPNRRILEMGAPTESAVGALGKVAGGLYSMYDQSGQVEIRVWECLNPGGKKEHQTGVACQVDLDYVLVGGGARTVYSGGGALLTEARPWSSALMSFVASSKTHVVSDPHQLLVYSIGMRLTGVTSWDLWNQAKYLSKTSTTASAAPKVGVDLDNSYVAVGGGAKTNWTGAGNLLVSSHGLQRSWYAEGKDHKVSSPATITAYVIGIKASIPGWGGLSAYTANGNCSATAGGTLTAATYMPTGYVLTGPGAYGTYQGAGRLLTAVYPDPNSRGWSNASSKDHITGSTGQVCAFITAVKKI